MKWWGKGSQSPPGEDLEKQDCFYGEIHLFQKLHLPKHYQIQLLEAIKFSWIMIADRDPEVISLQTGVLLKE